MSFLSMLSILFIALKLLDKVKWAWKWVLAPLWIPAAIALLVSIGYMVATLGGFFSF